MKKPKKGKSGAEPAAGAGQRTPRQPQPRSRRGERPSGRGELSSERGETASGGDEMTFRGANGVRDGAKCHFMAIKWVF